MNETLEGVQFIVHSGFGYVTAKIVKSQDNDTASYLAVITIPKAEFLRSFIEKDNDKSGYIEIKTQTRELEDALHYVLREISLLGQAVDHEEARLNDLQKSLTRLEYDIRETFELDGGQVQKC